MMELVLSSERTGNPLAFLLKARCQRTSERAETLTFTMMYSSILLC